jgi:hypothetical protein
MQSWPEGRYVLAGLRYRPAVNGNDEISVDRRLRWLRNTEEYNATAYQQLAEAYQLVGEEKTAETISIASLRDLRKRGDLRRRSRGWNRFLDWTVGYGYRLHRAFLILLGLGLLGALFYYLGEHAGLIFYIPGTVHVSANGACKPGFSCFNPFVYSFQLLIPGLDLREATYWWPDSSRHPWGLLLTIYTWLMIVLGWVLATAVVAGITQLFRRR